MTTSTAIAEYSKTEAALAELRTKYGNPEAYTVTTTEGMATAKKARGELRKYRVELEKTRQEIKAPALERCRLIDSEAARIEEELRKLEGPIDAKIKAEEERKEREKVAAEAAKRALVEAAQRQCNDLRATVVQAVNTPAANIEALIGKVKTYGVPDNEHRADVETVREQTLTQLNNMLAKAKASEAESKRLEAERAELERLRAEAARQQAEAEAKAKAERDRIAAEERAAKERVEAQAKAERDRLEAEKRKAEAERQAAEAKAAAERKAADEAAARARAEADRIAAEARAKEDARLNAERAKLEAERRAAEEAARKEREAAEARARAEQEAAEAKAKAERAAEEERARAAEAARIKSLTGRAMLGEFVARYGADPEFVGIAGHIEAWLAEARPVEQIEAPAPAKAPVKKKGAA